MKQLRAALIDALNQQLTWLERSAQAFDAGVLDEALRMSVPLRVLLHDSNNSHSLLRQLNIKRTVQFLSTAEIPRGTPSFWSALTSIQLSGNPVGAEYEPRLDQALSRRLVTFDAWWRGEVVYVIDKNADQNLYRKDVVLLAAHKGGGAHVDPHLSAPWEWLMHGAGASITNNPVEGSPSIAPFADAHLAPLRQIAYEILLTPGLRNLR